MPTFKMRSVDWDESWDDAIEVSGYDSEDAVDNWCRAVDSHSGFVDGYPKGHTVEVRYDSGEIQRFKVSTDWDPRFFVRAELV